MCCVDHPYHPPLFLPVWCVGKATVYTECRGTILQYTVSLSLCFVTHWFSSHHHHLHQRLHLPSSSYPEKVYISWTFLGCHYASFPTRSLGFLELFSNSLLCVLATSHWNQFPAWISEEPCDLDGLEPDGPCWASLVLSTFWLPLSRSSLPPAWPLREPSLIWAVSIRTVPPLPCSKISFEFLFRTVDVYYLLCICCIFRILICLLSFIQSAFTKNSNTLFSNLQFSSSCSIIVQLISDYCSIIVSLFSSLKCFQIFWACYHQSINIIQVKVRLLLS